MPDSDALKVYREKRDFGRTTEPAGSGRAASDEPTFVIQKHDASTLHYDFRLEVEGVLKSWAVPKGPSTNPREKRLAIPTEDHPLEYAGFEGTIPEGEYGGGTVMVWDFGTYRNIKVIDDKQVPMADTITKGHVMVWLEGHKLKGGYSLIRTGGGPKPRWLLVKMDDDMAEPGLDVTASLPDSAQTGRSLETIATQAAGT
ncbi:MAG: DNA polymerase ligase N-terminal domain-containing protein [Anaerolineae bacterium]